MKVEVAVRGSPSLIVLMVSVSGRKSNTGLELWLRWFCGHCACDSVLPQLLKEQAVKHTSCFALASSPPP